MRAAKTVVAEPGTVGVDFIEACGVAAAADLTPSGAPGCGGGGAGVGACAAALVTKATVVAMVSPTVLEILLIDVFSKKPGIREHFNPRNDAGYRFHHKVQAQQLKEQRH